MLTILLKLPRTEKFSIGTEVRTSMYEMLKNILLASKIDICVLFYFFVLLIHFSNSFGVISPIFGLGQNTMKLIELYKQYYKEHSFTFPWSND